MTFYVLYATKYVLIHSIHIAENTQTQVSFASQIVCRKRVSSSTLNALSSLQTVEVGCHASAVVVVARGSAPAAGQRRRPYDSSPNLNPSKQ